MKKNKLGFAPLIIVIAFVVAVVIFTAYGLLKNRDSDRDISVLGIGLDFIIDNVVIIHEGTSDEHNVLTMDDPADPSSGNSATSTSDESTATNTPNSSTNTSEPAAQTPSSSGSQTESTVSKKSLNVNSYSFGYSTNTINVNPGDQVTLKLTNSGGKHDWVIDEISGARTKIINGGQSDTITFTIPQSAAGKTYKFYCSVGNHRALGMEGNLVISL